MHTPTELKAMTGAQRLDLMQRLASAYYGTDTFGALLTDDLGLARRTWYAWTDRGDVPISAIAAVEGWMQAPENQSRTTADLAEIAAQLSVVTAANAKIVAAIGRIVRRLPVESAYDAPSAPLPPGDDG